MENMKSSLDLTQRELNNKRSEHLDEIKEKSKQISILESQLRSIASNGGDILAKTISSPIIQEVYTTSLKVCFYYFLF